MGKRFNTGCAVVLVAGVLAGAAAPTGAASISAVAQVARRSTNDGVYTAAQASRGQEKFQQVCTACHKVSDHAGPKFAARWVDTTIGDLFELISSTMPEGNPGSLEKDDYVAILAFFLEESGYSEGKEELPADAEALQAIAIAPPAP